MSRPNARTGSGGCILPAGAGLGRPGWQENAQMANKLAGPTTFEEYSADEWRRLKNLIRTKLGDPVVLSAAEVVYLRLRVETLFSFPIQMELTIDQVLRVINLLPPQATAVIRDLIGRRREKRKRPAAATHEKWRKWHEEEHLSYGKIVKRHKDQTGKDVTRDAVIKAIARSKNKNNRR
jgi:hypothetical protein